MKNQSLRTRQRTSLAPTISVVAPCFNEAASLPEFIGRMTTACRNACGDSFEIVLINDGSTDSTWDIIAEASALEPRVLGLDLARNHGHQLAVTAGLAAAAGRRILIIDADLQDPPELLGTMMSQMDEGYDVVYGQRQQRKGESKFKLRTARAFYRILEKLTQISIPRDTGDFRLINRRTADILNKMPEQQRFLRGMVAWVGGRQVPLIYDRDPRFAGETKYTLRKMVRFAVDGITSFSAAPLKLATFLALFSGLIAVLVLIYAFFSYLFLDPVPGWTSTLAVMMFVAAAQFLCLGIMGEYLGRLYIEGKGRPLYIIARTTHDVTEVE